MIVVGSFVAPNFRDAARQGNLQWNLQFEFGTERE